MGNTPHLLHVGPGGAKHDGLSPGVKEALDPAAHTSGGPKAQLASTSNAGRNRRGQGPELRTATLAISPTLMYMSCRHPDVKGFASRLGIATHFLPSLTKGLRSTTV